MARDTARAMSQQTSRTYAGPSLSISLLCRLAAVGLVIGLGAILAAILALDSASAQLPDEPSCSYIEAGAAGPRGNLLRIQGASALYRSGNELKVSPGTNNAATAVCDGGVPTVANVDRVQISADRRFTLDELRGGSLTPGATRETRGSEIEITVDFERPSRALLLISGTRRPNVIEAKSLEGGKVGINLNRKADGRLPDLDLISPRTARLAIIGSKGPDRLSGAGLRSFAKDPPNRFFADGLFLKARAGADTVLGSPGSDAWLGGGGGKDLIRGGRGDDDIRLGNGSSTAYGGPGKDLFVHQSDVDFDTGHDRLFGGQGRDQIFANNFLVDTVHCGPGRDRVVRDRSDRAFSCETNDFPSFCGTSNACRTAQRQSLIAARQLRVSRNPQFAGERESRSRTAEP